MHRWPPDFTILEPSELVKACHHRTPARIYICWTSEEVGGYHAEICLMSCRLCICCYPLSSIVDCLWTTLDVGENAYYEGLTLPLLGVKIQKNEAPVVYTKFCAIAPLHDLDVGVRMSPRPRSPRMCCSVWIYGPKHL